VAVRGSRVSFTLDGYWMDFENEIVPSGGFDPDTGTPLRGNADRTLHRGLELGLRWQPMATQGLKIAASRSWNEYDSFIFHDYDWDLGQPTTVDFSGKPIALFPDHLLSATWSSTFGALSSDLQLRRVGKQYLDNTGDESRTIDPATVVDVALFWDWGQAGVAALDGLVATVRVFNLFDEEYETWGYYDSWGAGNYKLPAATRHFLVGATYGF